MAVPASSLEFLRKDKIITDLGDMNRVCDIIKAEKEYRERDSLENDPSWRQPIPYVLVTTAIGKMALMRRCKGQGEARLLGKYYLGAGGHVEDGHTVFYTALKEVTEELGLPLQTLELKGVLITSANPETPAGEVPVDDVHLCLFYRAATIYSNFGGAEPDKHEPQWIDAKSAQDYYMRMEKWSQAIVRDHIGMKHGTC